MGICMEEHTREAKLPRISGNVVINRDIGRQSCRTGVTCGGRKARAVVGVGERCVLLAVAVAGLGCEGVATTLVHVVAACKQTTQEFMPDCI